MKRFLSPPSEYIYFKNETDFPINISAWIKSSNKLQSEVIEPRENAILHSCVGEWHMDTMFENRDAWIEAGLGHMLIIGKFRSDPCAMGEYSWMEYREPFDCIYEKYSEEQIENVKGCIRFVKK